MIKTFIERPVLSTVVSIIIVILGVLGLTALPVTTYPDIAPATVSISATYPGANAENVLRSVVVPIEEQVNGVEDMAYITSSASNNGQATIQVFFKQGVNADIAAVNVQNRVARATPLLPTEVTRSGVVTQKQQTSALMFLTFFTENDKLDATFLQNYLDINIIPELKRINGIGDATVFGAKTYSMRVWLDPAKMASYGVVPADVTAAINSQSLEAAAGTLGQNSGNSFEYIVKYKGKLNEEKDYENIVIKSLGNSQLLYLKDIAKVELDAMSYSAMAENNGRPAISMGIFQTPGSNAQDIIVDIKKYLNEASKDFPDGVDYVINFDTNEFLSASIDKVLMTLLEAFILVFIVVFIFLQDLRSTLIPAIAVPVSIIGTFFFLNVFGYSLNLLTLFALVLAIGIVVDDAIVVVEAVHAKLEHGVKNVRQATITAMNEITGAIISITLVMAAVFIPVTFITGPTGVFYQQFGITLMVAIAISAVNALTLSPALCALFLKPHHTDEDYNKKSALGKFYYKFNVAFKAITTKYSKSLVFLFRHKWVTAAAFALTLGVLFFTAKTMPTGFIPNEDRGLIMYNLELPAGASLERTNFALKTFQQKASQVPGIKGITTLSGYSMINGAGANYGFGFIKLDPFADRKEKEKSVEHITMAMFGIGATISDANMIFFNPPSVPGFGSSSGFEFSLTDRAGGDLKELDEASKTLMFALMQRPEIQYASTSFNSNYPQYEMLIDVPKAMDAGVSMNDILSVMQGYVGGVYAADFAKYGKQYRVMVQSFPESRTDVQSLNSLFVRTRAGAMTPVSQFVTLEKVYGPQSVSRFNLFTAAKFNGAANPGYSTGDAIKVIDEVAAQNLSSRYAIAYSGLTREEIAAGSQTIIIFGLSLLFIYFLLSAQFESYMLPLSVILSLPFGVMGAFLGQYLFGLENNIYFQIALIMLVGLLAKNAILIVEFAVQRRRHGESIAMSAVNAAKARLRPILMTSLAFVFGMLPLVFSEGIGSVGNQSIGTGAAWGLLIGTIFGVLIIPVLYIIFQTLQEKIRPIVFEKDSNHHISE
ncbi:MAG TPA: efflux RND transporter permease subunit [Ferruginibacter sp.]|nr:efflux RND transporter permease subunit [Ferruginibacter sp.]HRO17769.1 efflux RND transporter permease subunit [Ferruginibacter sp.]